MTETKRRKRRAAPEVTTSTEAAAAPARDPEAAERALGRAVAVGLPLASVAGALVAGFLASVGSALLVLAAGALLGTIALLWASVRTLTGDAPLPAKLEEGASTFAVDPLEEEKRRVLRALKDLESEHAIGRIDDADYAEFVARYRADAKAVMREIDAAAAPAIAEAERVAREYLEERGLRPKAAPAAVLVEEPAAPAAPRRICDGCGTSNEPDAAFCKKCGATVGSATEGDDASA